MLLLVDSSTVICCAGSNAILTAAARSLRFPRVFWEVLEHTSVTPVWNSK
jgi:hypothetical protein